jgi:hypothetical protein
VAAAGVVGLLPIRDVRLRARAVAERLVLTSLSAEVGRSGRPMLVFHGGETYYFFLPEFASCPTCRV